MVTFNAETSFGGYGGFNFASAPPAPGSGPTFAVYDDGFVLADISGDTTLTSNWGYTNTPEQWNQSGGGSIELSSATGVGTAGVDEDDDAAPGLEVRIARNFPELLDGRLRCALELAFGYSNFDTDNHSILAADLNRVTDAFPLDGVIPPLAPYNGSFTGPGSLLGTMPVRSSESAAGGATISGQRRLDVDLYTFRFGPRLEAVVTESIGIYLGGGLALAYADGSYRFSSTVSYTGGSQSTSGGADEDEWLAGYFLEAGVHYRLAAAWTLFGSVQHRVYEDFKIRANNTRSELSFGDTFTLAAGIRYSF